jgi:hypothetical protein
MQNWKENFGKEIYQSELIVKFFLFYLMINQKLKGVNILPIVTAYKLI